MTNQEFLQICQETLGFLRSHGFSKGQFIVDPIARLPVVRFYGKTLAVECVWDTREDALDVMVCRLRDGKCPVEYALDSAGRRVRGHLLQILLDRGVRGFGFRKIPKDATLPQAWRSQLEDTARLLQKHGQAILGQEEIFD